MILCPYKDLGRYAPVIPGLEEAMQAVAAMKQWTPGTIHLPSGNRILVQDITLKPTEGALFEAHRDYLDVQYIVEGEETVGWAPLDNVTPTVEFNTEKDIGRYTGQAQFIRIPAGTCYVAYPEDAHMPGVTLDKERPARKLVFKLKL